MDPIFNRLGNLIKSIFQESNYLHGTEDGDSPYDPDLKAAEEEIENFLNNENRESERREDQKKRNIRPPENLRQDYANLKVPFASPFKKVEESYKKLIKKYHPDKFAGSPEKLKSATDISSRINRSFQNIEKYIDNC